jgi:hypothetical protein
MLVFFFLPSRFISDYGERSHTEGGRKDHHICAVCCCRTGKSGRVGSKLEVKKHIMERVPDYYKAYSHDGATICPPRPSRYSKPQSLENVKARENEFCGAQDCPADIYVDLFKWEVSSFDSWLGVFEKNQKVSLRACLSVSAHAHANLAF